MDRNNIEVIQNFVKDTCFGWDNNILDLVFVHKSYFSKVNIDISLYFHFFDNYLLQWLQFSIVNFLSCINQFNRWFYILIRFIINICWEYF